MSDQNKALVGRWRHEFWNRVNMAIVDELGAPAVLTYYPLTGELHGRGGSGSSKRFWPGA
jgi:hypothetical protein